MYLMSFFNNQRNAGIALVVCAVLMLIAAVASIVSEIIKDGDTNYSVIVIGIGSFIGALLYFGFGKKVMNGELFDKFDIVCSYVQVYGFVLIVEGIFTLWNNMGTGIVSIILGLIVLFIYKKITDGRATLFDKIIWVILLIVFFFTILAGIVLLFGIVTIPLGIAYMIIGIFMFMAILDNDVKAKFGM